MYLRVSLYNIEFATFRKGKDRVDANGVRASGTYGATGKDS
jgi:hypothetical protein